MINVFFDMDGVIAEWNEKATLEDIFSEGYFRNVSPNKVTINVLKNLFKKYVNTEPSQVRFFILSARYDDESNEENRFEKDKRYFLSKYDIKFPVCFVSCGKSKKEVFDLYPFLNPKDYNLLFDDHTPNLVDWENNKNIGIKWLNKINGSNKSKYEGLCIPAYRMNETSIMIMIEGIINHYVNE